MHKGYQNIGDVESSHIIAYPNRRRMFVWIVLFGILALLYIPFIILPIIAVITTADARNQLGAIVFLVLFMGSLFVMCIWVMRVYIAVTFSGEPILVINRAGIRVGKIYGFADIFLPWEEVKAVYGAPRIFCIRPVDTKRFLARLSPMMRFTCGLSAMAGAPITIYQSFLDQPVEAILRRMHAYYERELQLHKEQKRAEDMLHPETGKREIILYTSRLLLWAPLFLGGLSWLLGFIVLFTTPWQPPDLLTSVFLIISGVLLGPVMIWRLLHTPLLIINDEGISSPRMFMRTEIQWEEIAAVYGRVGERLWIDASSSGIVPFLTRQNKGKLAIPRYMDISIPQTVLAIPQHLLPIPIDRLLEQVRARFQEHLVHYGIEMHMY